MDLFVGVAATGMIVQKRNSINANGSPPTSPISHVGSNSSPRSSTALARTVMMHKLTVAKLEKSLSDPPVISLSTMFLRPYRWPRIGFGFQLVDIGLTACANSFH